MATRKIGIVGSRDFADLPRVKGFVRAMHKLHGDIMIVSGGAKGVDRAAEEAADELGIPKKIFKPDPNIKPFFKAAFARNTQIVEFSDEVYAFWIVKKESSGTIDTMRKALLSDKLAGIYTPRGVFPNMYEGKHNT